MGEAQSLPHVQREERVAPHTRARGRSAPLPPPFAVRHSGKRCPNRPRFEETALQVGAGCVTPTYPPPGCPRRRGCFEPWAAPWPRPESRGGIVPGGGPWLRPRGCGPPPAPLLPLVTGGGRSASAGALRATEGPRLGVPPPPLVPTSPESSHFLHFTLSCCRQSVMRLSFA